MNPWTTNRDGIFLRTCLCFAIAGCGSPIFALCQGCSDYKRAIGSFQPQASNRDPKLAANISPNFETAYLKQHRSGALKRRVESLWECMRNCDLYPRECGAKRLDGQKGFCGSDARLVVSSYHPPGTDPVSVKRKKKGASSDAPFYPACYFCFETPC
jgi:uncharacterized Fe-S radical SAM superfamily protein PflX